MMKFIVVFCLAVCALCNSCNNTTKPEKHYSKTMLEVDKLNTKDYLIYDTPTYDRLMADSKIKSININEGKLFNKYKNSKLDSLNYTFNDTLLTVSRLYLLGGLEGKIVTYEKKNDSIFLDEKMLAHVDTNAFKNDPTQEHIKYLELVTYMLTITTLKLDPSDKNKVIFYEGKRLK